MALTSLSPSGWYQALLSLPSLRRLPSVSRAIMPAELAEGDLYSQAQFLFKAGYREAAIIVASTAISRTLRRILDACPREYLSDLPEKTSRKQYAVFELTYFFLKKGVVDEQLNRDLNQFQKKASRAAYGVKLSTKKAEKMMTAFNALRPQLDEAMGRAALALPAHERVDKPQQPEFIPVRQANQLAVDLLPAIRLWHKRVSAIPESAANDPVAILNDLRGRVLISRRHYRDGLKLYNHPGQVGPKQSRRIVCLMNEALEQATADRRKLSTCEKEVVGKMFAEGRSADEINKRFGILQIANGQARGRDARQVEQWIASSSQEEVQHA